MITIKSMVSTIRNDKVVAQYTHSVEEANDIVDAVNRINDYIEQRMSRLKELGASPVRRGNVVEWDVKEFKYVETLDIVIG